MLETNLPKVLSLNDPTKKMSKSLGAKSYVAMSDDEAVVRNKIKSAVTDTGEAGTPMGIGAENLISLLHACGKGDVAEQLMSEYSTGNARRYAPLKEAVADAMVGLTNAFRARKSEIMADKEYVKSMIKLGADKAHGQAADTMKEVRRLVGLPKK